MPRTKLTPLPVGLIAALMLVGAWVFAAGPGTPTQTIAYRGHVELGGAPIGGTTIMVFELFDDEDPTNSTLTWNESHTLTPVAGDFAVVLGNVNALPDAAFDAAALFLRITIDGTQLSGLQPITPVWAAHRSERAYNQQVENDLTVTGGAYIGGDTLLDGPTTVDATLTVNGATQIKSGTDGVRVDGATVAVVSDAAHVALRLQAKGAAPVLTNGMLTTNTLGADSTYEAATRWTVVADYDPAFPSVTSRNVQLDNNRLHDYCGDVDGCMVRLIMRNWTTSPINQTDASIGPFHFYVGPGGRWRLSEQQQTSNADLVYGGRQGTDDNNSTEHIMRAWNCYFTDAVYGAGAGGSDSASGFSLLNYTNNSSYKPRCVLVIDD